MITAAFIEANSGKFVTEEMKLRLPGMMTKLSPEKAAKLLQYRRSLGIGRNTICNDISMCKSTLRRIECCKNERLMHSKHLRKILVYYLDNGVDISDF